VGRRLLLARSVTTNPILKTSHHHLRVEIVADLPRFKSLRGAWDALVADAKAGPFVSHSWLSAWWSAFGDGAEAVIILAWRGERLEAAIPLYRGRAAPYRSLPQLRFPTLRVLSDTRTGFNSFLVAPAATEAAAAVAEALLVRLPSWSTAILEPMRPSAAQDAFLSATASVGMRHVLERTMRGSIADLTTGWGDYLARRSRQVRKLIRQTRRRIAEGPYRVWTEQDGGPAVLDRFLDLSLHSWKGQAGTALGSLTPNRRFMHALWRGFEPTAGMRIHLLEMRGQDVAGLISFVDSKRVFGFAIDFREDHAKLSPSRFLLAHWLEENAARGIQIADFLRDSPFWRLYADQTYELSTLRLFPRMNTAWLAAQAAETIRPIGRRWRSEWWRRRRRRSAFKGTA
jgi:CelD/BcsL family acetyltransferase involved in cellulose biosynthesis